MNKKIIFKQEALPSGGFFFSTHSLYLRGIINRKLITMKYYFLLLPLLAMTLGCNGLTNKNDSLKNDEIQFEKNWKAFEKHHVGGVVNKDINLFLELIK